MPRRLHVASDAPLFHLASRLVACCIRCTLVPSCITSCCMLHAAGCTPRGLAAVKLPPTGWLSSAVVALRPRRVRTDWCMLDGAPPFVACCALYVARARSRIRTGWFALLAAARQSLSPVACCLTHARCSMAELHAAALADAKAELLALTAAHAALGEQAWHRPALHSGAFGATQRSA